MLRTAHRCRRDQARAAASRHSVYHVGDSLAYGTSLYLPQYLKGWKLQQKVDVSMQSYSVPGYVSALGSSLPRVVIVSAGTNGSPSAIALFKADVRKVLGIAGPKRCVIWANVVRPPYQGVSYDGINRALADLDRHNRHLLVFDWARTDPAQPRRALEDGVHVAVPFYKKRAQVLASMAKRCALNLPS